MPALTQPETTLTWDEYVEGELHSDVRHEFVNGLVYAMAGASDSHGRISGNLFAFLHQHLRGKPCEPFIADMKVKVENDLDTLGYYPDVIVACDPEDKNRYFREHPTVIFEIVSESTARIDRREKLLAYQTIPSLREYVILEQARMAATIHRNSNGWKPEHIEGLDGSVVLDSIDCTLSFADLYERVVWEPVKRKLPWEID